MKWWPTLAARLYTVIEALPAADGFVMHDGPPTSDRGSALWVSVGYSSRDAAGGDFDTDPGPVTGMREEAGTVLCEFVSWSGDTPFADHRTSTFALFDALDAAVRADQTLGVLPPSSTVDLSATPVPSADSKGSTFRLIVAVKYFARS